MVAAGRVVLGTGGRDRDQRGDARCPVYHRRGHRGDAGVGPDGVPQAPRPRRGPRRCRRPRPAGRWRLARSRRRRGRRPAAGCGARAATRRPGMPTRRASTGAARASSTTVAPTAYAAACRDTCAPQRYQPSAGVMPAARRPRPDRQAVDPVAGQPQEGRQQGDRGGHHDQHDQGHRDAARRDERNARDCQAEDRDDHGATGEDDGVTCRRHRSPDGLLDGEPAGEVLPVPGDARTARSRCRRRAPPCCRSPVPSSGTRSGRSSATAS